MACAAFLVDEGHVETALDASLLIDDGDEDWVLLIDDDGEEASFWIAAAKTDAVVQANADARNVRSS
jgi:hypothetical protein